MIEKYLILRLCKAKNGTLHMIKNTIKILIFSSVLVACQTYPLENKIVIDVQTSKKMNNSAAENKIDLIVAVGEKCPSEPGILTDTQIANNKKICYYIKP